MPRGYEKMRDKFFQQKIDAWNRRHPRDNMSRATRDRLYDNAQGKAARIHNSNNPDNPVGRGRT